MYKFHKNELLYFGGRIVIEMEDLERGEQNNIYSYLRQVLTCVLTKNTFMRHVSIAKLENTVTKQLVQLKQGEQS